MSRPNGNSGWPLTPELLRDLIRGEEGELRRRALPAAEVERIFRSGGFIGSVIQQHPVLSRGMDAAREMIAGHEQTGVSFPSGVVILADTLASGKGRFRRFWHAPQGGVWMTVAVVNTLLPEYLSLLSLTVGVAVCETVRHFGVDAELKWVNDVLASGRKIAGVLIETVRSPRFAEEYLLIGIGVNVNNEQFPDELAGRAIAMKTVLGQEIAPEEVALRLLAKLAWNIGLLYRQEARMLDAHGRDADAAAAAGRGQPIIDAWRRLSKTSGRRVRYGFDVMEKPQFEATALAVDDSGRIVLRLDDGTVICEQAGEIIYLD